MPALPLSEARTNTLLVEDNHNKRETNTAEKEGKRKMAILINVGDGKRGLLGFKKGCGELACAVALFSSPNAFYEIVLC